MTNPIRFVPLACRDAKKNLAHFVETVRNNIVSLQPCNKFNLNAWNIQDVTLKSDNNKFIYFCQLDVQPRKYYRGKLRNFNLPANIPDDKLMREPFRSFAKALISYDYAHEKYKSISTRAIALRYLAGR